MTPLTMETDVPTANVASSCPGFVFVAFYLFIFFSPHLPYPSLHGTGVASYPGSNYAGEEKRAWYILFAHALSFARVRASERRKTTRYE